MQIPVNQPFLSLNFKRAFSQTDNSALIAFRVIFGFLICCYCAYAFLSGSLTETYIRPGFTFSFIGFEFLKPLPGTGMYFYFGTMFLLGLMIMFAIFYRTAIISFAILWLTLYLMQKADYNNHNYLIFLLSFIMIFLPANRYFSFDVRRGAVKQSVTCSRWVIWIMMAQMAIVYFFAALYKLQPDWLSGKFLTIRFSALANHSLLGVFYGNPFFAKIISIGGFLFDLLIVPFLLWRRTSIPAFIISVLFHLFNFYTFRIGIFPFLCIAANLFFLDAELVRRAFFPAKAPYDSLRHIRKPKPAVWVIPALGVYLMLQLLLPLRAVFYPGNVFWTEEGYRMSWRMMLRTKSGRITFKVVDPISKMMWRINATERFSPRHARWLASSPDMIWQYAQHLQEEFKKQGYPDVEVYAVGAVSLNREPYRPLADSTVDLSEVSWSHLKHTTWIIPYKKANN